MLDKPLSYSKDEVHLRVLNNLNTAIKIPIKVSNFGNNFKAQDGEETRKAIKMNQT